MELANSEKRYYKLPQEEHIENAGRHKGDWLEILDACLQMHDEKDGYFAGAWVNERTKNWFPGLGPLESYGLVEKQATRRAGSRAYWKLRNPEGVRKALKELGVRR